MAIISMKALLETGVHFGHRTRKWNPRMKPYIFTERNNIHIIDLQQTLEALEVAYALVRDTVANGGAVLFVGTKRQAQETIELEATRCNSPYVNSRWLGGTLTNWQTIRSRIDELESLERRRDAGEFELLTKKEALTMQRRIERLEERLGGIRDMKSLPQLLFAVDVKREETAVHEANLLKIPVVALVDTNCDPSKVDYVIPSNDDAIRAIKLLTAKIAEAVLEGQALRKEDELEEGTTEAPAEAAELEMTDEELLGEATLAKLKTGEFDEPGAAASQDEPETEEELEASKQTEVEAEADQPPEEAEPSDAPEADQPPEEAEPSDAPEATDEAAEADPDTEEEPPVAETEAEPELSSEDEKE